MKRVEKMIPSAIKSVTDCRIADETGARYEVSKEFNGYISSFGASIVSSGLLPTMIFFSNKGSSKANRHYIIKAVEQILKQNNYLKPEDNLLKTIESLVRKNDNSGLSRISELVSDAAISLKLAIRTFPEKN